MANLSQAFYEASMDAIEAAISPERLDPYVRMAGGGKVAGVRLYERNTLLCEALYGVIQGLEVTLRNGFHRKLTEGFGKEWYDNFDWKPPELKMLRKAKEKIVGGEPASGRMPTPGKMVAELSFGFWAGLTSGRYLDKIWIPLLRHAFPYGASSRKDAFDRLEQIRVLRNRVAHHEGVLNRDLPADYAMLLETIGWICPVTAEWVRRTNCFDERFYRRAGM